LCISAINMALLTAIFLPSCMKKWKYNPACVEDEVSISDILTRCGPVASYEAFTTRYVETHYTLHWRHNGAYFCVL
jgi:hypothetical protein